MVCICGTNEQTVESYCGIKTGERTADREITSSVLLERWTCVLLYLSGCVVTDTALLKYRVL
jgi:hypothetical protein